MKDKDWFGKRSEVESARLDDRVGVRNEKYKNNHRKYFSKHCVKNGHIYKMETFTGGRGFGFRCIKFEIFIQNLVSF